MTGFLAGGMTPAVPKGETPRQEEPFEFNLPTFQLQRLFSRIPKAYSTKPKSDAL